MLPPAPVLTGPKGGRYVETSTGRQYVDESYGQGHEKSALETTSEASRADESWKKVRDFNVSTDAVKTKSLAFKEMGTVWTVAAPGAGIAQYSHQSPHNTSSAALLESKSLVNRALMSNEHAKQFAIFAEEKIAELKKVHGDNPAIQPHIDRLREDQREAETSRDNMLALAAKVYEDYQQKFVAEKAEREASQKIDLERGIHPESAKPLEMQKSPLVAFAVQKHFDDVGLGNIHRQQTNSWTASSSSTGAMKLHGVLSASGVPGSAGITHSDPLEVGERTEAFDAGRQDPKMQQYVREMYSLTQAALRDAGVNEITLYRGVSAKQEVPPIVGTKVKVETRPASSWTDRKGTADSFASARGRVLKTTVPASAVYASHHLFGNHSNENEFVVLGATRFDMEVAG